MITNAHYFKGSGKEVDAEIQALIAGPATTIYNVIMIKPDQWVILYA